MSFGMAPDNGRVNRVSKLIVNPDTGPIYCCWDTCDRRSRQTWSIRMHEHDRRVPCSTVDQSDGSHGRHAFYTFCSQQHADYWASCSSWNAHETAARNGGRIWGMASEGNHVRVSNPGHAAPRPEVKIWLPGMGWSKAV